MILQVYLHVSGCCDFFVTLLQVFIFGQRSFSKNFINHVSDSLEGGLAVYRGNKVLLWLTSHVSDCFWARMILKSWIFIDRVAGAIIRLVSSVCPSVCLWALSCLNRLTFHLDFWHEDRP